MQQINHRIFEAINYSEASHPLLVEFGHFAAVYLIFGVPLLMVIGWLVGGDRIRAILWEAFIAILVAIGVSALIGVLWPQPRPYVVEIGNTLLEKRESPSFPSDHATAILTLAATLLIHETTRRLGAAVAAAALLVVWARIYIGFHFPLDMLGAVVLAGVAAVVAAGARDWFVVPLYERVARPLFRRLFAPAIERGWIDP